MRWDGLTKRKAGWAGGAGRKGRWAGKAGQTGGLAGQLDARDRVGEPPRNVAASSRWWGQRRPQQRPAHRKDASRGLGARYCRGRWQRWHRVWRRCAWWWQGRYVCKRRWCQCQSAGAAQAAKPRVAWFFRLKRLGLFGEWRGWRLGRVVAVWSE